MFKQLYTKLENFLLPLQWLVDIGLIAIILLSGYFLFFNKDSVARTTWVVYMFMP